MSTPVLASAQSRSASAAVDISVVIDRVRVVAHAHTYSSATPCGWPSTVHVGDCRIRIRELLIEIHADTDFVAAYRLGREVARELVDGLLSIQERRLHALLHSHNGMGPVMIESLRARLLGTEADNLSAHVICRELLEAIEGTILQ